MTLPQITKLEACQILFKGQSNVKVMANELGITLEEMQRHFGIYCDANPVSDDAWQRDVEISWPYAT